MESRQKVNNFYQDLVPICTKIKNESLDSNKGLRPTQVNKIILDPIPSVIFQEVQIKSQDRAVKKKYDFTVSKKKIEKLPAISTPSLSDLSPTPKENNESPIQKKNISSVIDSKLSIASYPKQSQKKPVKKSNFKSFPKQTSLKSKSSSKVTYEEASAFPEWVLISKPEILKTWKSLFYSSNGIFPVIEKTGYKYYIGKGEHSEALRKLLSCRSCWTETLALSEASFLWTQCKESEIIESLPKREKLNYEVDKNFVCPLSCQTPVKINEEYRQVDISNLGLDKIRDKSSFVSLKTLNYVPSEHRVYNKLEFSQVLTDKKCLLKSLKIYYKSIGQKAFKHHPISFVVSSPDDFEYRKFIETFKDFEKTKGKRREKNIWILKPENTSEGVKVCKSLKEISSIIASSQAKAVLIQKYLEKPFLINSRKFEIRAFALVTSFNGVIQGYFYPDGYLKTSTVEYNLDYTDNSEIHLTDPTQNHSENSGKCENDSGLSYQDFQHYLDSNFFEKSHKFKETVLPGIKKIVKNSITATCSTIDCNKRLNCFEILRFDFILDQKFKPWLIGVNPNPCLDIPLPELIPEILENVFRLTIDCFFPTSTQNAFEPVQKNKFELILHSLRCVFN